MYEITKKLLTVVAVTLMVGTGFIAMADNDSDAAAGSYTDFKNDSSFAIKEALVWVLGNANGDCAIDTADINEINKAITNKASARDYPLCDANNDKSIDSKDVDFVRSMINGTATKIYYFEYVSSANGIIKDENICEYPVISKDTVTYMATVHRCVSRTAFLYSENNKEPYYKVVGCDNGTFTENEFGLKARTGTDAKYTTSDASTPITNIGSVNAVDDTVVAKLEANSIKAGGHLTVLVMSNTKSTMQEHFKDDIARGDVSIVMLPSWEDHSYNGILTTGYLLGGVLKTSAWQKAVDFYNWNQKYLDVIDAEVAKIAEKDKPVVFCTYSTSTGQNDRSRSVGSGDMENTIRCGAINIGDRFGPNQANDWTMAELATYCKDIDILINLPGNSFDKGGNWMNQALKDFTAYVDGYIDDDVDIWTTTWQLSGTDYVVALVWYFKTFWPDNQAAKDWSMEKAWNEYLKLEGYDDRDDMKYSSVSLSSSGKDHTTTDLYGDGSGDSEKKSGGDNTMLYVGIGIVALIAIIAAAFLLRRRTA